MMIGKFAVDLQIVLIIGVATAGGGRTPLFGNRGGTGRGIWAILLRNLGE